MDIGGVSGSSLMLGRSLLAAATLLTLASNPAEVLFTEAAGIPAGPHCAGLGRLGLFCLMEPHLEWARWLGAALLAPTLTGHLPRASAILHWWVAFSLQSSATLLDGGDQVAAVMTFLLIPLVFAVAPRRRRLIHNPASGVGFGQVSFGALRVQVAIIYLHAGVAKLGVAEWVDGTALYYHLNNPFLAVPDWVLQTLSGPLSNAFFVTALTWGTIALECGLGIAALLPGTYRRVFFFSGVTFHACIAVMMGLVTFSLTMIGALTLYLGGDVVHSLRTERALRTRVMQRVQARITEGAQPSSLRQSEM